MTAKGYAVAAGAVLLACAASYGLGRYTAPAKVETRTVTEVQVETEWKDRVVEKRVEGPVRTVIKTVERLVACVPGETTPEKETTTTVDVGPVVISRLDDSTGRSEAEEKVKTVTITTTEQPRLMLQAGASLGLGLSPEWSLGGSYRLAGPFWLGASYLSTQRVEARVSLTF